MYTQHCIIGKYISMGFLSFSILACLTRWLFLNNIKISFCLDWAYYSWAFASLFVHLFIRNQISDEDTIWTCFRYFLCCLQPSLFAVKSADTKSAYIGNAQSVCIKDAYASNTYARGTCIGNAFSVINAYIKGADRENTCIRDASIVKHSRIHLQFFLISEVKLFNTSW